MEAIETKEVRGYTIEIHQDEDAESPREWSTFGTMFCTHRRYNLGDKQIGSMAKGEFDRLINRKDVKYLPLYLYDHSGLTMSTSSFSCPWDSGQVGIILVTHDDIRKEFGPQGRALGHITQKAITSAFKLMRQEVEVYDAFLQGNVYGYVILDKNGDTVDSCWGFICVDGKLDYVYEAAMENLPKEKMEIGIGHRANEE